MNPRLFVGAAIITGGALLKMGAPPLAILAGVFLAAVFTWRRQRS